MQSISCHIRGLSPMLHHSAVLSDSLSEPAKRLKVLSAKRNKTEEDLVEMARVELIGGLYWNEEYGLHVPAENIEACIRGGAKFRKLGTAFNRAARVVETCCPMTGTGAPATPEEIANDPRFVSRRSAKVGTSRVMRTRAVFDTWETQFTVAYDKAQIDRDDIVQAIITAGAMVGLGDWRPRFGTFELVEVA